MQTKNIVAITESQNNLMIEETLNFIFVRQIQIYTDYLFVQAFQTIPKNREV